MFEDALDYARLLNQGNDPRFATASEAYQGVDFSAIVALSERAVPSVDSLQMTSGRAETLNAELDEVLPAIEADVTHGTLVTLEDSRVRTRKLPFE